MWPVCWICPWRIVTDWQSSFRKNRAYHWTGVMNAPLSGDKSLVDKEGLGNDDMENVKKLREIAKSDTLQAKVLKEALVLEGFCSWYGYTRRRYYHRTGGPYRAYP